MTFDEIEQALGRTLPAAYKAYVCRIQAGVIGFPNALVLSDLSRLMYINQVLIDASGSPSISSQPSLVASFLGAKPRQNRPDPLLAGFNADHRFMIGSQEDGMFYLECVGDCDSVYHYQLSTQSVVRTFQHFEQFEQYAEAMVAGVEGKGFLA